jgi:CheY-like chemotaxis protein
MQKKLILVIEDEAVLLTAIQKKLNNSGFATVTTGSAEEALDYLKTDARKPDLIWLDYLLPGKDGLQFVIELKKHPKLNKIPIFVISNTAGPDKIKSMIALGVKKYFVKAEKNLEDIMKEINNFINKGD